MNATENTTAAGSATVGAAAFLELLARDAAAVEYDGPLVAARVAGAPPELVAQLEAAKQLALQVRATLAHSRRREAELVALFETAGDLAALSDLDAVLKAIVSRAHTLVGADVSYLTLDDSERADTYMRVTHGSISAHFQSLRLPMGAGLGGLVAQTAKPYVTADYMHDARFHHTTDIDSAVGEEGLVAILGVPLLLGKRVIGVLFTANRSPRPFARHEIALLSSFAAHAAVAIDNARLLQSSRDALAELRAANLLVREKSDAVERAAAVHDKLADLVVRGGDADSIAKAVAEALGGRLVILDADGAVLAQADGAGAPEHASDASDQWAKTLPELIAASAATGRAARHGNHMVSAVTAAAEPLGAVVLTREPGPEARARSGAVGVAEAASGLPPLATAEFSATDQRILERAALVVALHHLISRSAAVAAERLGGDLLDDLLAVPVRHTSTLIERARRIGVDLDRPHIVVAVDVAPPDRARVAFGAGRLAGTEHGLSGSHEGRTVLLLPGDDPSSAARRVHAALKGGLAQDITVGAGGPRAGVAAFAEAHSEAVRCLSVLHGLRRTGSAAGPADLGFVGVVLGGADPGEVVHRALGPVLDYDAKRGTDLLGTIEEYFASGRSLARTGEALHIHVNTVTQRLERTARLLGPDWQDPARSLEIQLALQLRRVMRQG